ncbi:MAG: hypothetical protein C0615_03650 [Desulfuromonas sp.]|nr:MAG: hypothetical protein C0615_03650 [Desulfuromonas sp.]
METQLWFWLSVAVLAGLLFWPAGNLIWVVSVRRQHRRLGRELSSNELTGQRRRARFIAFFVCSIFSLFFCLNLLGWPSHG